MSAGPQLVDATCTCGSYLWRVSVPIWGPAPDGVDGEVVTHRVELDACPRCDRPRCLTCREPFGKLLTPVGVPRWGLDESTTRCEACSPSVQTDSPPAAAA